jgi:hypothetical protein
MIAMPLGAVGLPAVKRWIKKNSPSSPREPGRAAAAGDRGTAGAEVASLEGNLHLPLPKERV